jgi:hypothetical protein
MTDLCITTNLTGAEWAAWVQAIGSIAAVIGAAAIAIWQSRTQHRSALALLLAEKRHATLETALTLGTLATNCAAEVSRLTESLSSRQAVSSFATGEQHLDLGELRVLENAVLAIPLYSLPHPLVSPAMVLGSTLRQFRSTVEFALQHHRAMNSDAFDRFFSSCSAMSGSLSSLLADIEQEIGELDGEA